MFAQAKKPRKPSKAEVAAINAMLSAQSPDDQIKAAEDLVTKFSETDFKALALYVEANAWEMKNNHDKAVVYAEQALETDPKQYDADFLIANVTAAQAKDTDLDLNDKLTRAEKAANEGLENLKAASKPTQFQLTDAQWENNRKISESQAWQALGIIASLRKKPADAMTDFNKALALNPDPIFMLRAGRAMLAAKNYDEAINWFDKAAAAPDANDQIRKIAASDKARTLALKGH
jgi:tetratricopeptide (TPR) repeat protein